MTVALSYKKPVVQLVGQDGNAFSILGRVSSAMKRAGATKDEVDQMFKEATSGDYNHLLQTVMQYVEEGYPDEDDDDEDLDEDDEDLDEDEDEDEDE